MVNFAKRLREFRTEADMKQEQLAEKIGVRRMTIHRWEKNDNPPSDENLLLLAQLFNTSTFYLTGVIDDRDIVFTEDVEVAEEKLRNADKDSLPGIYRMLSREMKILVHSMTKNALYVEHLKKEKQIYSCVMKTSTTASA